MMENSFRVYIEILKSTFTFFTSEDIEND